MQKEGWWIVQSEDYSSPMHEKAHYSRRVSRVVRKTVLSESASSGGDVMGLSSRSRQEASRGGFIGGLVSAEGSAGSCVAVSDSLGDDAVSGVQPYTGAKHGSGTDRSAQ